MRKHIYVVSFLAVVSICEASSELQHQEDIAIHPATELKWFEGPSSLPKGAKIAILEGDPTKEGPFVFRVKLPDGYRIPPHTHGKPERITVITGIFNVGMGEKFDESKGRAMPAGTYGQWPEGMKHYVWTKGETVLQFHGIGSWTITYVNPGDDPRNQKRSRKAVIDDPEVTFPLLSAFKGLR